MFGDVFAASEKEFFFLYDDNFVEIDENVKEVDSGNDEFEDSIYIGGVF